MCGGHNSDEQRRRQCNGTQGGNRHGRAFEITANVVDVLSGMFGFFAKWIFSGVGIGPQGTGTTHDSHEYVHIVGIGQILTRRSFPAAV